MDKKDSFLWGCSILRDNIDKDMYGNVSFSIKKGDITGVKVETFQNPPVDKNSEKT